MKKGSVTIKDIARALNVSTSTVSRALRNMPDINPETKKAVVKLSEQWDYYPNAVALSLVKKKTNIIGVIVPNILAHFFSSAISGIQEVAAEAGYNVMITQSGELFESEISNVNTLISSRADGMLISHSANTKNSEHFQMIVDRGVPLIFFDRAWDEMDVTKVLVDDYEGAKLVVNHLLAEGNKRIAFITGPFAMNMSKKRLEGYKDTLLINKIDVDESLIIETNLSKKEVESATKRLLSLEKRPDAIIGIIDSVAIIAMTVLKEAGLSIPEDIALIGFGDEPVSSLVTPTLSSLNQYSHELGRLAAKEILNQIASKGHEMYLSRKLTLKPSLIVRKSSVREKKY